MTAAEILDEHFKVMGAKLHESHRTFVLFAMEEYARQQLKILNKPVVRYRIQKGGSPNVTIV